MLKPTNSKSINKNIINKKTMRREFIFPLVVGIILGALLMILWQFNARVSNIGTALNQLEQATAQNTKTVNDIVAFINQATGANQKAATETPATSD
jgi:hypothetical protein